MWEGNSICEMRLWEGRSCWYLLKSGVSVFVGGGPVWCSPCKLANAGAYSHMTVPFLQHIGMRTGTGNMYLMEPL